MYSSKPDDWEAYLTTGLPTIQCHDGITELKVSRTCKELTKYLQSRSSVLSTQEIKRDVTDQLKSEPLDIKQEIPDSKDFSFSDYNYR